MKVIHGLSLCSKEDIQVAVDYHDASDDVYFEIEGGHFDADFVLGRRQCRELRDWLNVVLDD